MVLQQLVLKFSSSMVCWLHYACPRWGQASRPHVTPLFISLVLCSTAAVQLFSHSASSDY
jgi:hypothetical protein